MPRRPTHSLTIGVLVVATVLAGCGSDSSEATARRQAAVAERGAHVMPFDLEATTHHFDPTDFGGVQTVVADDPDDADQVALIREHLTQERAAFASGDFGDPARIHGNSMPGLSELEAGYADITVTYAEVPDGARLTYRSADPDLVDALHRWFAAQLADHGPHATGG